MTPSFDPSSSALILIEYQNEFTSAGGKLHDAVKGVMASSSMLDNTIETVAAARRKGVLIIHVPIVFSDDYRELQDNPYGILANVKSGGCFKKSDWGSQFYQDLAPQPNDVIIEGKRGLCAFASTNLDFVLRQRKIQNVALCGFLTNCCVESTMRTAYEKGYHVITLTDCTAATSEDGQAGAVRNTFPMFSVPMVHTTLIDSLA